MRLDIMPLVLVRGHSRRRDAEGREDASPIALEALGAHEVKLRLGAVEPLQVPELRDEEQAAIRRSGVIGQTVVPIVGPG